MEQNLLLYTNGFTHPITSPAFQNFHLHTVAAAASPGVILSPDITYPDLSKGLKQRKEGI